MAIKINDIPPEGLTVTLADELDLFDEGTAGTPFTAQVTVKAEGAGIFHVNGTVEATASLECSRCLKRFIFPIKEAAMDFDLVPEGARQVRARHGVLPGRRDRAQRVHQGAAAPGHPHGPDPQRRLQRPLPGLRRRPERTGLRLPDRTIGGCRKSLRRA
jgi:hypothetical protein